MSDVHCDYLVSYSQGNLQNAFTQPYRDLAEALDYVAKRIFSPEWRGMKIWIDGPAGLHLDDNALRARLGENRNAHQQEARREGGPLLLRFEKPVFRPWQAEILSQRLALIFAPKDSALLQFRNHAIDEVVEPGGQIGEHDIEAVAAFRDEPLLHLIGDGLRRADER